jgi:hypothetical protein
VIDSIGARTWWTSAAVTAGTVVCTIDPSSVSARRGTTDSESTVRPSRLPALTPSQLQLAPIFLLTDNCVGDVRQLWVILPQVRISFGVDGVLIGILSVLGIDRLNHIHVSLGDDAEWGESHGIQVRIVVKVDVDLRRPAKEVSKL